MGMLLLCLVAYCSAAALANGHKDHHHDLQHGHDDHDHHKNHEEDHDADHEHGDHEHHHADHLYHHESHDHDHENHDHPKDHHAHHHEDGHDEGDHDHPHNHKLGDHLGQLLNKDQEHYHPSLKPDGQVVVDTMLKIRSIGPIDPRAKTLTLVLTHREKFTDPRLADQGRTEMATLVGKDCDLIWTS